MKYTHGDIPNRSLHWKMIGRTFVIMAIREGDAAANEFMAANPGASALQTIGDWVIMVDKNDVGVPFDG